MIYLNSILCLKVGGCKQIAGCGTFAIATEVEDSSKVVDCTTCRLSNNGKILNDFGDDERAKFP